jgi:hypothetical protein
MIVGCICQLSAYLLIIILFNVHLLKNDSEELLQIESVGNALEIHCLYSLYLVHC